VRVTEATALGRLAGEATGSPALLARDLHAAIAARTFGALGLLGAPARVIHEGITSAVYRSVGAALRGPAGAAVATLLRGGSAGDAALADSSRGGVALGALNGAIGDTLVRDYGDLAVELTVREGGRPVGLSEDAVAAAFPAAGPRLAVFVHGLCETEHSWRGFGSAARPTYGARLRDELGYTPVYVRYNSGLHVSDNGRRLAEVLDELVRAWPAQVKRIALVGHSMGGLVARSACHHGQGAGHEWVGALRHVFCLGTPHLGAPLEKAANVAGSTLSRLPETRPFARLVNQRSAGIKDLRYGSCVEEDWLDRDPDELLRDRCGEVPFLPGATYCFVAATLADDRLGSLVGDLLVRRPSASGQGRTRRVPFEIGNGRHIAGLNHFQLLNHPAVYDQLRVWLERPG
jgi:pimeloyl-ACP methyl ester carboxylesterase